MPGPTLEDTGHDLVGEEDITDLLLCGDNIISHQETSREERGREPRGQPSAALYSYSPTPEIRALLAGAF
jgi:hypothetical protein